MTIALRFALGAAVTGALAVAGAAVFGVAGAVVPALIGIAAAYWYGRTLSRDAGRLAESIVREGAGPAADWRFNTPELNRVAEAADRLSVWLGKRIADETAERARLAGIFEAIQEGVLVVDAGGVVISANQAALHLLAGPRSFRPGQLLTSLTNNFAINDAATGAARSGLPRQTQVELHDMRKYLQVTAVPLGESGGARKAVVLISDLTESRRVEVTRREFVSNVSHELRTPIASIRAAAETLRRGALRDPQAADDFLTMIEKDAVRMEALVQEMLELSRLESGQTPLHLVPLETGPFILAVSNRFDHQASAKGITLAATSAAAEASGVMADQVQLERLLSNLVSNALKFTPAGGIVTLSAAKDGSDVLLSVADTGPGIGREHLPHIFERFYKADGSRSEGGSGLGLAIARHIAIGLGGAISVESTLGQGSKFTVRLPALTRD